MKTVEEAHAAGHRDGSQGLGPIPPKDGRAGTLAHRLYRAYMQSYRDSLMAKVGAERRERPRSRNRRRRALVALYAQRPGGPVLKYIGRGKFAARGRARLFDTPAAATVAASILKDSFPDALRAYRLFAK